MSKVKINNIEVRISIKFLVLILFLFNLYFTCKIKKSYNAMR